MIEPSPGGGPLVITFDSDRAPDYGDFFVNYAFPDPTDFASNLGLGVSGIPNGHINTDDPNFFIATPGVFVAVAEPSPLALFSVGSMAVVVLAIRRSGPGWHDHDNVSEAPCSRWRRAADVPSFSASVNSSRKTSERPDAWVCELTLQVTAIELASTAAMSAASQPQESASHAGPIATAVAIAVGGSQRSADSGPTSGVAAQVAAPRRLHARASDQGCLPIEVEHYVMLPHWTRRELRAGRFRITWAPIMDRLELNRSNWVETVRGYARLFKQAAERPSSLLDAAARRSRRWFQDKAAPRTAFV
jgi:hypothetical protein